MEDREGLSPGGRWLALDDLRGLAILVMIPVNAAMKMAGMPSWFKHAQLSVPSGDGMTVADFVMPAFLFALGVSSSFSLRRRLAADGLARTAGHALLRNLLLFAFGSAGWFLVYGGRTGDWEVLQMLGAVGALAFPFLLLPPWARFASAAAILGGVELLRPAFFGPAYRAWFDSGLGGPLGTISLAAIPVAASALGETLKEGSPKARILVSLACGCGLLAIGMAVSPFSPPNKPLLSLSYLASATGASSIALGLLTAAREARNIAIPPLGAMGRNPLLMYILSGLATLALRAVMPAEATPLGSWAACLGVVVTLSLVAILLDRRNLHIRL